MQDNDDKLFGALSDPSRRRILELLHDGPKTTTEIARSFSLSRFAVMKHLRVLENAGLISVKRQGRQRYNAKNPILVGHLLSRWVSASTSWGPTFEGKIMSTPSLGDADPKDEPQKEIQLIVRAEEKYAVERALQSVMPPVYTTTQVVGRSQTSETESAVLPSFRPGILFCVSVPGSHVAPVLRAVMSALRLAGGPKERGRGLALVASLDADIVIGQKSHANQERAKAEGWAP